MIASPGDVLEAREVVRDVIHEWNYVNSHSAKAVLMPVGWETHSSPELGERPQELINERILQDCDLLVGIFWTRLGTPTGKSTSGTVEEIERHLAAGKPAMVYFSTAPVAPQSIDQEQFSALTQFRQWCQGRGLVETFDNIVDFRQKFSRHLQIALNKNPYLSGLVRAAENTGAADVPSVGHEAPQNGLSQLAHDLSEEARTLLVEASLAQDGVIFKLVTLGGRFIQTNSKTFGDASGAWQK